MKENPDDQNLSLLWTTFLTRSVVVLLSPFRISMRLTPHTILAQELFLEEARLYPDSIPSHP